MAPEIQRHIRQPLVPDPESHCLMGTLSRPRSAGDGDRWWGRPSAHAPSCLMPWLLLAGCEGLWDNMSCWPSSVLGQTVEVGCPQFLRMLTGRNGNHTVQGVLAVRQEVALLWGHALAWRPRNLWGQAVDGMVGGGPCWGLEALLGGMGWARLQGPKGGGQEAFTRT